MLLKTENERINKELKNLVENFRQDYEKTRQLSEAKYKNSLKPGETFREQKGFYYSEDKAEFQKICESVREKAHDIVNRATLDIMTKNMTAPSTEAVNVIALLNTRQNVSADEIDQLMTAYGRDCPMVYKALYEKAESLGYRDFKPHPVTELAENIERLNHSIDWDINADINNFTVTASALNTYIDATFPVGE